MRQAITSRLDAGRFVLATVAALALCAWAPAQAAAAPVHHKHHHAVQHKPAPSPSPLPICDGGPIIPGPPCAVPQF